MLSTIYIKSQLNCKDYQFGLKSMTSTLIYVFIYLFLVVCERV